MLGRIFLRVDISTKKFIDTSGYEVKQIDLPRINYASECILCLKFYSVERNSETPLTPYPFDSNALFSCRGDNNFNFDDDLMFCSEQRISSPPVWLANTNYFAGNTISSSSGDWYVCYESGTSGASEPAWNTSLGDITNDNNIEWIRVSNNDGVNQPNDFYDWDSDNPIDATADPTKGEVSIRLNTFTQKFKLFVEQNLSITKSENVRTLIQVYVLGSGNINYSPIVSSPFRAGGILDSNYGIPIPAYPDYLTASQISQTYVRKDKLNLVNPVEVNENSETITVNTPLNIINSSSSSVSTINGAVAGQLAIFYPKTGQSITFKHLTGNLILSGGNDIVISDNDSIQFMFDGSFWRMIGLSGGGSSSGVTEEEATAIAKKQAIIFG